MKKNKVLVAGVPFCLLMRIMERMRGSVISIRIIAHRTRMRTLGSAYTVLKILRLPEPCLTEVTEDL